MTKLISGRVKKIPSANVSASRYDFLKLSEAEPDLGLPAANGYVLSGNVDGTRRWVLPAAVATAAENANVANTVLSISNFTTANLAEGVNLYYTNARVYANVIGLLNAKANVLDLTTANVVELTNLYYSNDRVYSNVIGLLNAKANVSDLTTANVVESTNSLYYNNARVDSYVTPKLTTANVIESASNLYYTNVRVQNYLERVDGNILPISSGPYDIGSETHAWRDLWLQGTSVKFVNSGSLSAQSNTFTITDARGNVVFTANATNIPITSPDGKLSASLLSGVVNYSTSNVAEGSNLYYTNARVDSYVTPKLTTANVVESASNLYYTESRANTAIDNRVTKTFVENLGISVNTATFAQTANVANTVLSLNNFTTANLVEDTNLYYTNARVISAVTPYLTTANVIESAGNLYYTESRANTAIDNRVTKAFIDNLGISSNTATFAETANVANTVLSISNFTTSNLTEGTNLYYTNSRVYSNVIGLINVKANVSDLTTANVTEIGNNIFYTNARVYANVSAILPYYTGNLSAGNILANTIVATGGSSGTISATTDFSISAGSNINLIAPNTFANNLTVNRITSNIWTGLYAANIVGLTTANVTELDNLYYTNARVYSNISPLLFNYQTLANAALKANISDLTTANVTELDNLYYTNARVYSNVIGLLNAKANIADLTTANVAELNNLYYTNARVYSNVIGLLDAKANVADLNTSNIIEGNNLYFTNARVLAGLVTSNLVVNDATVLGNLYVEGDVVTLNAATLSIEDKNIVLANGAINSTVADGAGINIDGAQANLKYRNTGDKFEFNKSLDVLGTITANTWGGLYAANIIGLTTANVAELTNLYYTNNRVYSNVVSILPTYTGNVAAGNVTIGSGTGGSLIGANLISATYISATNWIGIYTANVVESPGNLYYTNARAYANLTSASINALADVDTVTLTPSPGQALLWNGTTWVPNTITISAVELANVANSVVQIASAALVANTAIFAQNANIANIVLSISNFTTSNLDEGTNLYYTNARVYSNVIGLLNAKANVSDLTTSNVVELNNLYYTNARVYSNVIGLLNAKANVVDLTTSNVVEGDNLYYTNARVYSNVISILTNYATVSNLSLKANVVDLTTANVIESASNLYYTVERANTAIDARVNKAFVESLGITTNTAVFAETSNVSNTVLSIGNFTTSNLAEGTNLYYSNDRVYSNVIGLINVKANVSDLTTANVIELTNLYYTNARVYSNVIGLLNAKANVVDLTTSNVVEGDNLYYTNARARTAISAGDTSIIYDPVAGTIKANATITAAIEYQVNNLSTSTVTEGANLYYTNARVYSNVIALLPTLAGTGIAIEANGQIRSTTTAGSITGLNTANVAELTNLYYTNARVYSNVIGLLNDKANVSDLTTANIIESASNLYFSNARVLAGLVGQNVDINDLLVRGDLIVQGNTVTLNTATVIVEDKNLVLANGAVNSGAADGAGFNIDGAQANLMYRSTGDKFEFNKSLDVLGTLTTATISANVWNNLYTSNVIEGNNLYYTNARVYSNVIGLLNNLATAANLNLKANVVDLTTANVAELNNLYYTNARVYSNVIATLPTYTGNVNAGNLIANVIIGQGGGFITGANLISTNVISATTWTGLYAANVIGLTTANVTELNNLYYTNARVYSNVIGLLNNLATAANLNLKANVVDLTTANVTELNNLYYTNARVYSNVASLLPTYTGNVNAGNIIANTIIGTGSGGSITGANLISTNVISATTWTGLYASNVIGLTTANVTELNNLYYTNARVYSNVIGLLNNLATAANLNLKANVVDLTTANVTELTNLYYTNARVYSNVIALLQTLAGNNIIIAANGQISANLLAAGGGAASSVLANGVIGLNTANVNEFGSNLYYTNARVYSNVVNILSTYTGNVNAGNIIANTIVGTGGGGSITGANLISTNVISATTWIGLYASNVLGLNTANVAELTNLYYTNARVYSNVIGLLNNLATAANLNLKANVVDLTTANVTESPSNLYYTNARVIAGLVGQDVTVNNVTIRGDLIVEGNTVTLNTTTVIVEDKDIMLANGAINAAAADGAGFHIDGAQANLRYRNTGDKFEFNKSLDVLGTLTANSWSNLYAANVIGLTTANVSEVTNLYYTNARTYSNVLALLPTLAGSGISIAANGQISSVSTAPNVLSIVGLNTANVAESASNLYYTNARVYSNVVAMLPNVGVRIASSFQQFVANGAATVFTLSTSITDATSIFVIIDGLTQIPTLDYTAANTTLTLLSTPVNQSNVVVRYFSAVLVP